VLAKLGVTLKLTESYTKEGTGKISRTDYLYNKVIVDSVHSAMAELEKNEVLAQSALANTVGMPWSAIVQPADETMPDVPVVGDLDDLVADAYQFNPDWARLEAGLRAAEGAERTAKSDYFPKLALKGDLHKFWNGGFNSGIATAQNEAGWTVGVGLEIPIFNGLLTQNKAHEALLRVQKLKETQLLLKDGLGLQVKSLLLDLHTSQKMLAASTEAAQAAEQNSDLNARAYESDMAEPDKVIQAQIMAALTMAQQLRNRYETIAAASQLKTVIGHEISNQLVASSATSR
jgi:outer membrane protein TolC